MEISIIMSVYKENEDVLRKSIKSILNQSFKDFEFIIILDNPKNISAKKLIKSYLLEDKRIVFLENNKNIGLAKSLNKGINIAKGEFIARMDAEDICVKNRLELQLNYLLKNPDTDLLFSWTKYIDEKDNILGEFKPQNEYCKNLKKYFFKYGLFSHPTLMVKTKVIKNMKYDPEMKYAQDLELWLRCINKGLKINIIEKYLLKYRLPFTDDDKKINKFTIGSKYAIKAFNKNFKNYYKNIYFYKEYIHYLFRYLVLIIFPNKIIKLILKIKLNLKNDKY